MVYSYCITTYGTTFVEKYIENPFTNAQGKAIVRGAITFSGIFAADQVNRSICSFRCSSEIKERLED